MKSKLEWNYYVGDFETTVYPGQQYTEVWASAIVQLYTEDVTILHSIGETWDYIKSLPGNLAIYYHNLKFDGAFWLDYILKHTKLKPAWIIRSTNTNKLGKPKDLSWRELKDMPFGSYRYSISDMGQWYSITIRTQHRYIEFRDSLKLMPFSVKQIGQAFKTKHQKLEMEYEGFRFAGCNITAEEQEYIANDVLVVKEGLETMFDEGHNSLTIGSCCLKEFKKITGKADYKIRFPNLYEIELDPKIYGSSNADEYIRKSYKGGWCYLVKGKENQLKHNGVTADVNSLYPSVMHSQSGSYYPVGQPCFWQGNQIPVKALSQQYYYFVRIRTRFYLRPGYLPFVQMKNNYRYLGTECLETSDIYNPETGGYDSYIIKNGKKELVTVELTLTQTDYELLKEHYELVDMEILDGCYFYADIGIFDGYVDKYAKIKMESKGARRTLAKLFLNNLYGKMGASRNSSFKVAYLDEKDVVKYYAVSEEAKAPGYIAIGSAITSYARNFTIRAAQKNYYGKDKPGFIYADTDSCHIDLPVEEIKGIPVHPTAFCHWKLESYWDEAIFARQKTYIEHITHEDGEPVEEPYYNIKCAGMPERCKHYLDLSLRGAEPYEGEELTESQLEFIHTHRTLEDFRPGLKVPGKLLPKRVPGGIVLTDTDYEMRY